MDFSQINALEGQLYTQVTYLVPIIIGIIITLLQCFFGFKLFRYIMGFWGFLLFGFVGYHIGQAIGQQFGQPVSAALALCAILGAAGAFIAYKYYKVGVFLQGFIAGLIVGMIIAFIIGWKFLLALCVGIVLGVLLGFLSAYLLRFMVIITSAISGGMSSGSALAGIFGFAGSVGVFLGVIFTIMGMIFQFYNTKGHDKDKKHDKDNKEKDKAESSDAAQIKQDVKPVDTGQHDIKEEEAGEGKPVSEPEMTTPAIPATPAEGEASGVAEKN